MCTHMTQSVFTVEYTNGTFFFSMFYCEYFFKLHAYLIYAAFFSQQTFWCIRYYRSEMRTGVINDINNDALI